MQLVPFVLFDGETGEIQRWGSCEPDDLALQGDGTALEGDGRPETHYVLDGQLVAYTVDQLAAKGQRPQGLARWSNTGMSWAEQRTESEVLADAKAAKWVVIKAARDAMEFGTFVWDGSAFDCDLLSQIRLQAAYDGAREAIDLAQPFSKRWKLANDSFRDLDKLEIVEVKRALGLNTENAHVIAAGLWVTLQEVTNIDQLEQIEWPSA